jgi:adenylate cyclase
MAKANTRRWISNGAALLLAVVISAGFIWAVRSAGFLEQAELRHYDWMLRLRPPSPVNQPRITLIDVTDDFISHEYPVKDETLARVIRAALDGGARGVGLDIYRDLPVPDTGEKEPPGRRLLNQVLADIRVVPITKIKDETSRGVPPPPLFASIPDRVGFNDTVYDSDGVVRRCLWFMNDRAGNPYQSLAFKLAALYLDPLGITPQGAEDDPESTRLGKITFRPLHQHSGPYVSLTAGSVAGCQFMLDFKRADCFEPITLTRVLAGQASDTYFKDRIVLIGTRTTSVKDLTPTSVNYVTQYGIEYHAMALDQFLRGALDGDEPIRMLSTRKLFWICIIAACYGGLAVLVSRLQARSVIVLALSAFAFFLVTQFTLNRGLFIPSIPPVLCMGASGVLLITYTAVMERSDRSTLMQLFGRYVDPGVAREIWADRDDIFSATGVRSRKVFATVLFTDLEGFTRLSEQSPPEAVISKLSELLAAMSQTVRSHDGMVNKFIGDAVMAVFGVPVPHLTLEEQRRDALNAVRCAIAMRDTFAKLTANWAEEGKPMMRMRIGVHSGFLVAGSVGGGERLEYTVIGDTVNVASRLESMDKSMMSDQFVVNRCRILISAQTKALIGDEIPMFRVGEMELHNRKLPVEVHCVQ